MATPQPSESPGSPSTGSPRGLPSDWDHRTDLVVACGGWAGRAVDPLPGEARAIAWLPPGYLGPPPPAPFRVAPDAAGVFEQVLALGGRVPRRLHVLSTGDPWAGEERLREAALLVQRAVSSRELQQRTVAKSGPVWLEQALANLPAIAEHPSIHALAGAFAGLPAVLVSPGPSLERNVARLAALRGRALVLTGTHALGVLRSHGVRPDLVLAADSGDLLRHWEGVPPAEVGALAVGVSCRADQYRLEVPRRFVFSSNESVEGWILDALGEPGHLPTGGSVACSALSLALHLGCEPIAFVGQDLAFADGRYYASGGLDDEARVVANADGTFFLRKPGGSAGPGQAQPDGSVRFTRDQRLSEVPAYGGAGRVLTSEALRSFLAWFEMAATRVGERRLWNCTEGGARIHGTRELPLEQAERGWTRRFDAGERFDRASRGLLPDRRRAVLREHLDGLLDALGPCVAAARRCRELSGDPRRLDRLALAEGELKRALVPLPLLSVYAQGEIAAATAAAARAGSVAENLAAARSLFEAVERAGARLGEHLRRARAALEA